jgi:hypothetical protein
MYTTINFYQCLRAAVHSNQEIVKTFFLDQVSFKLRDINTFTYFKELLGGLWIHLLIYNSL